jgi:chemotaxis protein methyltransferase CheR
VTLAATDFDLVRRLAQERSALVLDPGKEYLVSSRLATLAASRGTTLPELFAALRSRRDPDLETLVVEALTTNETLFFRDGHPFHALRETILPELLASRGGRGVTIWSAACSSGQEPYTVAMIAEEAGVLGQVRIVATDLNRAMVDRTRAGVYSPLEVNRGLPASHLVKYFSRAPGGYLVDQRLRSAVTARTANLVDDREPFPQADVVLLRNVLIYFDAATKMRVLERVRRCLAPDGYLLLGTAETTIGLGDTWARVPLGKALGYRPAGAPAPRPAAAVPPPRQSPVPPAVVSAAPARFGATPARPGVQAFPPAADISSTPFRFSQPR